MLINLAFGEAEKFFIDGDRITHNEVVESMRVGKFFLASVGEELVGCVYIEPRGPRAYLGLLSVDPRWQAKGIGSRLMTIAEEHCRKLGCKYMDIKTVNVRTELAGYYEKQGYIAVGTTPFPSDVETKLPCHFVDMTKPLS